MRSSIRAELFASMLLLSACSSDSEGSGSDGSGDGSVADGSETGDGDGSDDGSEGNGNDGSGGDGSVADGSSDDDGSDGDADGSEGDGNDGSEGDGSVDELDPFSFFVTSQVALIEFSGSEDGFGGDFRYGETGAGAGLRGADKLCAEIAETSMPGSAAKEWRAFLSATAGEDGEPVNAKDRIGQGPWYDRVGRLVAEDLEGLLQTRPASDAEIANDLPNETGTPNHNPGTGTVDNHHVLTGSNTDGELEDDEASTCQDWTSSEASGGRPRVGLSWPRNTGGGGGGGGPGGTGGSHWISALDESGCAPGANTTNQMGGGIGQGTVGSSGGYGAIYCFALTP